MNTAVAGAPVSFGVFELTPEGAEVVQPDDMMAALAGSGYTGIDLGPLGYLGEGEELHRRLQRHGLDLAGGWVQLPFADDAAFEASLPTLHEAIGVFERAAADNRGLAPVPTLADDGSAARRRAPGRGAAVDPLPDAGWETMVGNVERAAELVRAAGLTPTFHHHAGTYVESDEEIDRFLARSSVDLTLDTGHLILAGADPLDVLRRWHGRVNHLHLKDVDAAELQAVLAAGGGMREVWSSASFVALGEGSLDVEQLMNDLEESQYAGWIIVEQDVLCGEGFALDEFFAARIADQTRSREVLRRWS